MTRSRVFAFVICLPLLTNALSWPADARAGPEWTLCSRCDGLIPGQRGYWCRTATVKRRFMSQCYETPTRPTSTPDPSLLRCMHIDGGHSSAMECMCQDGFCGEFCNNTCGVSCYGDGLRNFENECGCERVFCENHGFLQYCRVDRDVNGSVSSVDFSCDCLSNYGGKRCERCEPGFYGPLCQPCPDDCSEHGRTCRDGISGDGSCESASAEGVMIALEGVYLALLVVAVLELARRLAQPSPSRVRIHMLILITVTVALRPLILLVVSLKPNAGNNSVFPFLMDLPTIVLSLAYLVLVNHLFSDIQHRQRFATATFYTLRPEMQGLAHSAPPLSLVDLTSSLLLSPGRNSFRYSNPRHIVSHLQDLQRLLMGFMVIGFLAGTPLLAVSGNSESCLFSQITNGFWALLFVSFVVMYGVALGRLQELKEVWRAEQEKQETSELEHTPRHTVWTLSQLVALAAVSIYVTALRAVLCLLAVGIRTRDVVHPGSATTSITAAFHTLFFYVAVEIVPIVCYLHLLRAPEPVVYESDERSWWLEPSELQISKTPLGDGADGTVYPARYRGKDVAGKKKNSLAGPDHLAELTDEAKALWSLRHKNTLEFVGIALKAPDAYIVTELCSQSLESWLLGFEGFDSGVQETNRSVAKLHILVGIVEGLNFIHGRRYIHGDIKPSNILLDRLGNPKIGDLGSALRFCTHDEPMNSPMCGTVEFMAPELFGDVREYTPAADIFSIGVLMWCMAFEKRAPDFPGINYTSSNPMSLGRHIVAGLRPSLEGIQSQQLVDLISDCVRPERALRPSAAMLLQSLGTLRHTDALFCVQPPTPGEDSTS